MIPARNLILGLLLLAGCQNKPLDDLELQMNRLEQAVKVLTEITEKEMCKDGTLSKEIYWQCLPEGPRKEACRTCAQVAKLDSCNICSGFKK